MKKAVAHLEQFLEKKEGATKGTVVLATVFGDVHDIGKNLVNTILTNNGYTVHDLGKQVPMNTILEKAVEVNADAIGLSALLVSTSKQMPICVARARIARLAISGDRRRRRDQSRFRTPHRAARRRRTLLRTRPVLREGRVRRARHHGPLDDQTARRAAFVETDSQRSVRAARSRAYAAVHQPKRRRFRPSRASTSIFRSRRSGDAQTLDAHRRRRAVAVLRSQESLPAVVGREQYEG